MAILRLRPTHDPQNGKANTAKYRVLSQTLKDPLDGKGTLASLLKEVMERGTALPVQPQDPLGSMVKTWKN